MELENLVGKHFLSGCQSGQASTRNEWDWEYPNTIDFILDGKNISVVEDPDDGYRSSMREIVEDRPGLEITNVFPAIEVVGVLRGGNDAVVDFFDCITGKVVLSVGTADFDDYYPYFVAEFTPENMCLNAKR